MHQSRRFVDRVLAESSSVLISTGLSLHIQTREFHGLAKGPTQGPCGHRTTLYGLDFLTYR